MSDNGTFDRIAGKAKETTGKVTGSKETETEGKLQQAEGKVKEVAEDAKDAIKGAVNRPPGGGEMRARHAARGRPRGGGGGGALSFCRLLLRIPTSAFCRN